MDNLVERLRTMAKHGEKMVGYATLGDELYAEAAAEIERLRAENVRLNNTFNARAVWKDRLVKAEAEIARADYATRRAVERAEQAEAELAKWKPDTQRGGPRDPLAIWYDRAIAAEAERDNAIKRMEAGWIQVCAEPAIKIFKDAAERAEAEVVALRALIQQVRGLYQVTHIHAAIDAAMTREQP